VSEAYMGMMAESGHTKTRLAHKLSIYLTGVAEVQSQEIAVARVCR
jgi:hypothetical protein